MSRIYHAFYSEKNIARKHALSAKQFNGVLCVEFRKGLSSSVERVHIGWDNDHDDDNQPEVDITYLPCRIVQVGKNY